MHLDVGDRAGRRPLAGELLERARRAELAGATVFHAVEGFGTSGQLHRARTFQDDEPAAVVVVETPEHIAAFLEANQDLLAGLLVTVEDVELVRFPPGA